MERVVMALVFASIPFIAFGNVSSIAIQSEDKGDMHVYLNGKLYNRHPGKFVRIKSRPGLFHVEIKVFNPINKNWYLIRKDIWVTKGFEFYYCIRFSNGQRPILVQTKKYPVYSPYFINPALHNRHYIG